MAATFKASKAQETSLPVERHPCPMRVDVREVYNVVPHSVPGVPYRAQIVPAQALRSVDQVINIDVMESSSSSFRLRGFYSVKFEEEGQREAQSPCLLQSTSQTSDDGAAELWRKHSRGIQHYGSIVFYFGIRISSGYASLKCEWVDVQWVSAKANGYETDVIFIDFSKTFDKVSHGRLLKKLNAHGVGDPLLPWIEDFLVRLTFTVRAA
ncbi:unnamed protein product [Echinostoma caproni]|uniref:Reverse transcriptase domain-containing protein n=1 Tax=Echinostoma caproni TaxID=27848 RepID=A0A183AX04_9TREM|nr:unnamed protein product [Echinostoma caproni]